MQMPSQRGAGLRRVRTSGELFAQREQTPAQQGPLLRFGKQGTRRHHDSEMSLKKTALNHCHRRLRRWAAVLAVALLAPFSATCAQQGGDDTIVEAREALRKRDKSRLAAARAAAVADRHPLAMWTDYWELGNRLSELTQDDLEAFYSRWSGTYVEDRLRNDWLLELGRRRDWRNFATEFPRFQMNDDREVTCYALLVDHLAGRPVRDAARAAWMAQRDTDDGCLQLATTLYAGRQFDAADLWRKARVMTDAGRLQTARQAINVVGPELGQSAGEVFDSPTRYLARRASSVQRNAAELTTLALMRMASNDPEAAARLLDERWERALPADLAAWAWNSVARQAAFKLLPQSAAYFERADRRASAHHAAGLGDSDWHDDTLAWKARAALRASVGRPTESARWTQLLAAIDAMSAGEQRDPAWMYWKARALKATSADGIDGAPLRAEGHALMMRLSGQHNFYGMLAAEELGEPLVLPARPSPLTADELQGAAHHGGLTRALHLIAIGLRNEGVREWNFSLRGMGDRALLAAAQRACDREVWDRCINTSERTRHEVDIEQRFPMPFRSEVVARAQEIGLDPAYVYGLIRQESRFVMDARSGVGATGLMQVMPATARWTARKIGMAFRPEMLAERDVNLKIGTSYLKLVLDDFEGSQAMAAAAYNAGPSRPRRWREGPLLEVAAWAENIPFNETRDYVKKVLSNATYYSALLSTPAPSLRARMGRAIGPRDALTPEPYPELP
jgi:soluble lytic murein transglycosylase